ncbi:hypothetical protein G7085_10155 [Tessaracoccus sp. HDW20]|uniref:hypothetical protein n=1 Tax=Tessaracoccus coleopterorum TaxID=2714950 RepID=UPI0018D39FAE|nr:hypothetical protein [Tessaracoccus coleopterorum]NHB84839.1 hypothetical protein [Tessaracoccus coleopterorum]
MWRATAPDPGQRFADGADLHATLLELRGALGRPHNVLAGGEVTRMLPGPQRQNFPASGVLPGAPPPSSSPRSTLPPCRAARGPSCWGHRRGGRGRRRLRGDHRPAECARELRRGAAGFHPIGAGQTSPTVPSPEPTSRWSGGPGLVAPASPVCFAGLTSIGGFYTAQTVDCDTGHEWEAFLVGSLSEDTPSANIDDVDADPAVIEACTTEALAAYTGTAADGMEIRVLPPSEAAFEGGSRLFYCVASEGTGTGSFRAS